MQAQELLAHFQEIGHWVPWDRSEDQFLHGDPADTVRGIAVAWSATNQALQAAAARGLNLFITHEPVFYPLYADTPSGETLRARKRALLQSLGLVLLRCHDTLDRMPEVGVVDAWAGFLGFPAEARPPESFYRICLVDGLTVEALARHIRERIRPLGEDYVLLLGDRQRPVRRLAVGTGAITHLPSMYAMEPDAILATDDGMSFPTGGLWAVDLDLPVLIVNHATSEKPGMEALARYLSNKYPAVPIEYIDVPLSPTLA